MLIRTLGGEHAGRNASKWPPGRGADAGRGAGVWCPTSGNEGAGPYHRRPDGVEGPADAAAR